MAGCHRILVPGTADGDLAAFAVGHLHPVADLRTDAFEQRGVKFRAAAVAAEQFAIRIRPDDRNGFDFARIERHQIIRVFEQRDGLARRLQREFAVRFAADNPLGFVGIHIRIIEQSQLELPKQHRRHQIVELGFLQHALADEFDEVQIAVRLRELDVHPGAHGQRAGFLFIIGHEVPVRVRDGNPVPKSRSNPKPQSL